MTQLSALRITLSLAASILCIGSHSWAQKPGGKKDPYNYEAQKAAPAKVHKIVIIASRADHGARGNHEFFAGSLYFARTINARYKNAYAVVYDEKQWPKDLTGVSAVIVLLNHGGPAAEDANIKAAVAKGAGFGAIHFGVEVNKGDQGSNYLSWMGGYFETFWSVNPWWTPEPLLVGNHPVLNGVHPFSIRDEWYYHMRFQENMMGVTPLISAVPPVSSLTYVDNMPTERGGNADVMKEVQAKEPQHLAWAYQRRNGRGFGFTGFHNYYNLQNDDFRKLLLNGVAWVSGLDIPKNGIETPTPTKEELDTLMAEAHAAK